MILLPDETQNIPLSNFTPLVNLAGRKPSESISKYLQKILESNSVKSGGTVTFPSIMAMARFFKTNHLEVHDAFQSLRFQGYDYELKGMDHPIRFWYTAVSVEKVSDKGRI